MAFIDNSKVKLFAGTMDTMLPYVKNSKSYFANEIQGKKNGTTMNLYLPDPGDSVSGADVTAADGTIKELEVPVTLEMRSAKADFTVLQKVGSIEDFSKQIAFPKSMNLAASVEKDIIAKTALKATGAIVVTAASFTALGKIAAGLRDAGVASEQVGFLSNNLQSDVLASGANLYQAPSDYATRSWEDAAVGRFAGAEWYQDAYMPNYTAGTFVGTSATKINAVSGVDTASTVTITDAALTSASTITEGTVFYVAGLNQVGLANVGINEKFALIVKSAVCSTGSAVLTLVNKIIFDGAGKNVDATSIANNTVVTGAMTAGKKYQVIQVRAVEALAFDQYTLPEIPGTNAIAASYDKNGVKIYGAESGNASTYDFMVRFTLPYAAELVDPRMARIALVQVD